MRLLSGIAVLLFLVLIVSCGGLDRPLVIGLVPSTRPDELKRTFESIRIYLEREMRTEIDVMVPDTYHELVAGMKSGSVDIALFGPFSYIVADRQQKLEPLVVRKLRNMGVTYHSILITRTESDIRSIEALRDRSFAFVDTDSTSGYVMPYALFKSRGFDIDDYFSGYRFAGSHDKVLDEVLAGDAEAGAMSKSILESLIEKGRLRREDVRILWESDPIPGSPFIARADLQRTLRSRFVNAMTTIHEQDTAALEAFSGSIERFVPIESGMYNGIRSIVNILGEDLIIRTYLGNQ